MRHALPALEDAFRTASLPDAGARLICVRRLQLGQLAANASAQSVSLLIEKRFAEDDWTIVHAVAGGADGAQAVWFRDALEAHEAAALTIAAGQPLDDWFWPLAIPAITAAASEERLRAIALAVGSMEEAPAALPAWTASLVRAGYRSQLIAALRPGDGRALMRSAGFSALPTAVRREHALTPDHHRHGAGTGQARTSPAEPQQVSDRGQRNEELDDRVVFVELMTSRASERPQRWPSAIASPSKRTADNAPAAVVPAPDASARALGEHGTPAPAARRETIEHGIEPPSPRLAQPADATGETGRGEAAEAPPGERRPASSPDSHDVPRAHSAASDRAALDAPHTFESPWQLPEGAPTAAGGLMFLLPVLERVGFAKWAAGAPDRRTGARRAGRADLPSAALAVARR